MTIQATDSCQRSDHKLVERGAGSSKLCNTEQRHNIFHAIAHSRRRDRGGNTQKRSAWPTDVPSCLVDRPPKPMPQLTAYQTAESQLALKNIAQKSLEGTNPFKPHRSYLPSSFSPSSFHDLDGFPPTNHLPFSEPMAGLLCSKLAHMLAVCL